MQTQIKSPEADPIHQYNQARQVLLDKRQEYVDLVAIIDQTLGGSPSKPQLKAAKPTKAPKAGGIREGVLVAVASPVTMKEIQALLSEHSAKSVETVVHSLVSAGTITKDNSSPKKFSLVAK